MRKQQQMKTAPGGVPVERKERTGREIGRGPSRLVILGCFALLAVLGWLDYVTGYEMSFFVFYSVPVGLAAWFVGRWPAIVLALAATLTWLLADFYSGAKYSAPFFYYWNSTIHFLAFIINAVTISKIKAELDRRQILAAELETTRQKLRSVGRMPFCPACGKSRNGVGSRSATALGADSEADSDSPSAVCPACRDSVPREG